MCLSTVYHTCTWSTGNARNQDVPILSVYHTCTWSTGNARNQDVPIHSVPHLHVEYRKREEPGCAYPQCTTPARGVQETRGTRMCLSTVYHTCTWSTGNGRCRTRLSLCMHRRGHSIYRSLLQMPASVRVQCYRSKMNNTLFRIRHSPQCCRSRDQSSARVVVLGHYPKAATLDFFESDLSIFLNFRFPQNACCAHARRADYYNGRFARASRMHED